MTGWIVVAVLSLVLAGQGITTWWVTSRNWLTIADRWDQLADGADGLYVTWKRLGQPSLASASIGKATEYRRKADECRRHARPWTR